MNRPLNYIILIAFMLTQGQMKGQNSGFSVSMGSGILFYSGDLTDRFLPYSEQLHPHLNFSLSYHFSPLFYSSFGLMVGRVSGADSLTSRNEIRNYHFRSDIVDLHLITGMDAVELFKKIFKADGIQKRFDHLAVVSGPKIFVGAGLFHFNPEAQFQGNWKKLRPLGTEGQYIEGDYPDPYKLWQLNLKFGGEMGFHLNKKLRIDFYGIYNYLFTDYLDDVSGDFPDYNELLTTSNGLLASNFTYRLNDGSIPAKGSPRGNPEVNDSYVFLGLKITYLLSKSELSKMRNN